MKVARKKDGTIEATIQKLSKSICTNNLANVRKLVNKRDGTIPLQLLGKLTGSSEDIVINYEVQGQQRVKVL